MPTLRHTRAAPDGLSVLFPEGLSPEAGGPRRFELAGGEVDADRPVARLEVRGRGLDYDADGRPVAGTVRAVDVLGADGERLVRLRDLDFPASLFGWSYENGQADRLYQALIADGARFLGRGADDVMRGGMGDDTFAGRGGADFFVPLDGRDVIDGGGGFDQISYAEGVFFGATRGEGVVLDIARGRVREDGGRDRFEDIEGFRLSLADDRAKGSAGDDLVRPLLGEDTLDGRGGTDTVAYDDDAGFGGTAGVAVDLARGRATDGFGTLDRLKRVENVIGTSADDRIEGDRAANELRGGGGDDTLGGGRGEDTLSGFEGADVFLFDRRPREGDADILPDFEPGVDSIAVRGRPFGRLPEGPLAPEAFVAGEVPEADAAGPTFLYDTDGGVLSFDRDGDGPRAPVAVAILPGAPPLSAADIDVF